MPLLRTRTGTYQFTAAGCSNISRKRDTADEEERSVQCIQGHPQPGASGKLCHEGGRNQVGDSENCKGRDGHGVGKGRMIRQP